MLTYQARSLIRAALPWAAFALALALIAVLAGCVSVPEDDGGTTYAVPVWTSGPDGSEGPAGPLEFLPPWAKALLGVAAAVAFPRTRRNLVGVAAAGVARWQQER